MPFVDGCDEIQTLRAKGVAQISCLGPSPPPSDIEERFPLARGWAAGLARPAEDANLLIGQDNQKWMQQPHGGRQPQADEVGAGASTYADGASRKNCSLRSESGELGRPGIERAQDQRGTSARQTRQTGQVARAQARRPQNGLPKEDSGNGGAASSGNNADCSIQSI